MSPKYKALMSPLKVRNYIFKNRLIASTSLPHFLQGPETYPAESVIKHFINKARGASVVTCTGINNATTNLQFPMDLDMGHFPDYDLYDNTSQNYLVQMSESIHFYGSIASMSIFVGPPSSYTLIKKKEPNLVQGNINGVEKNDEKPFDIPLLDEFEIEKIPAHEAPDFYDEETLDKIADSYAEQAEILKKLGFDMVCVHCCYRGNLPAKFMSPLTNKRTDKFGGSLENRMRFPLMVFERIRQRVGNDFLIEMLWTGEDVEGSYTFDESVAFLNEVKKYIDIAQIRCDDGGASSYTNYTLEEAPLLDLTGRIKKLVPGLLISAVNGVHDLDLCESAIAEGKADLIASARSWLSNPDYGQLALEGRGGDVVPCLRCNKCHGRGEKDVFASVCSVNPKLGLEHLVDFMETPTQGGKKVAVIGGGPAGMRCALYLKERGHVPVIYEASASLGGVLKHADTVPFKWTLSKFKNWLVRQVSEKGIEVRLDTRATPEMLQNEGYDVIIAAVGAKPVVPPIPGLDKEKVLFAVDVLADESIAGSNVVIIGGGDVGVETGIHLARTGHKATVLEMRDKLAADATLIHYYGEMMRAWEAEENFTGIVNARVSKVQDGAVHYTDADGKEQSVQADTIMVAAGMRPLSDEALSFYGIANEFYVIGDSLKPQTIQQAMREAYGTASRI